MDNIAIMFMNSDEYKRALDLFERAEKEPHWEEGYLGAFVKEAFIKSDRGSIKASKIHELYTVWAKANNQPELSKVMLGKGMRSMLETKRKTDGVYYLGIKESPFRKPVYKLLNKETNKTNGEYLSEDGVVLLIQDYWLHMNEGQELPERFIDLSIEDIRLGLEELGLYAESVYDNFMYEKI